MKLYSRSFQAMGSTCEIRLYANTETQANQCFDTAFGVVTRLERRYSRYLEDNVLFAINQAAKRGGSLSVDQETSALLDYADACYNNSEGLFDISSGVLRKAWDFKSASLPRPAEIERLLDCIGWDKICWKKQRISFAVPGMELDFGGIVKEYAADQSAVHCMNMGIQHGLINLGGDIRIIGPHPDHQPWVIGIRHPRRQNVLAGNINIRQGGVSSSGDYERYIEIGGRFYSHILNPKTGWPVSGLAAVTVIADYSLVAGSASTIAMLKGAEGKNWLAANKFQALWVDTDGRIENSIVNNS